MVIIVFNAVVELLIVVIGVIVVCMDAGSPLNIDTDVLDGLSENDPE